MISIRYFPLDWGFGNRILFYNNLRQIAEKNADTWSCIPWEGYDIFQKGILGERSMGNVTLNPCLGEKFFETHVISTKEIFKLKEEEKFNENVAAVHFRGGDFFGWNPDAVLDKDYYLNAVDSIKDQVDRFILFTEDESLESYAAVEAYFENENIEYNIGDNLRENYLNDFRKMSACDYVISSPSTFCICAAIIGKSPRVIHSEKWINNRVNAQDKFWVDLHAGGNEDYSIWRLV